MRILEVVTEHTQPFKVLIEVLKDVLPETNIEFRMEGELDKKKEDTKEDEENSDNSDTLDSSEEEEEEETNEKEEKKVVSRSGMRIMAVDSTKTVLINLKLDAANFTGFKCKQKKIVLGVNLVSLHRYIKSMDKDDNLTIYIDHDDKNHLKIRVDNPEKRKKEINELKLLDLGNSAMSVPDITFDAVVTISSTDFHRICRDFNQIAEFMEIKCSNNKIIFSCKGDSGKKTVEYTTDNSGEGLSIRHGEKNKGSPQIIQGVYELKNLVTFGKCSQLCNDIHIFMKNNYPLVIKYTVATLGRILLCLTPINEKSATDNYSDDDDYYSDEDVDII